MLFVSVVVKLDEGALDPSNVSVWTFSFGISASDGSSMGSSVALSWLAPVEEGPLHSPVKGLAGDAALELLCGTLESLFLTIVREIAGSPRKNRPSIGVLTEGTEP